CCKRNSRPADRETTAAPAHRTAVKCCRASSAREAEEPHRSPRALPPRRAPPAHAAWAPRTTRSPAAPRQKRPEFAQSAASRPASDRPGRKNYRSSRPSPGPRPPPRFWTAPLLRPFGGLHIPLMLLRPRRCAILQGPPIGPRRQQLAFRRAEPSRSEFLAMLLAGSK